MSGPQLQRPPPHKLVYLSLAYCMRGRTLSSAASLQPAGPAHTPPPTDMLSAPTRRLRRTSFCRPFSRAPSSRRMPSSSATRASRPPSAPCSSCRRAASAAWRCLSASRRLLRARGRGPGGRVVAVAWVWRTATTCEQAPGWFALALAQILAEPCRSPFCLQPLACRLVGCALVGQLGLCLG